LLPVLVAGLLVAGCASPPRGSPRWTTVDTTDRMIVKYRQRAGTEVVDASTTSSVDAVARRAEVGARHVRRTGSGSHILKFSRRLSLTHMQQLAAEIRAADPEVEYAEPDRIMTAQLVPNDPAYAQQWNYQDPVAGLNLPPAWDLSTGRGVTVAVIDTGYRPHADLVGNIVAGYDFITSAAIGNDGSGRDSSALDPGDAVDADECEAGSPARPSSWHGTHVAGTIAAVTHNALGVAGVAHGATVQPVRALGKCGGFTSDIADAIIWAAGGVVPGLPVNPTPARVINMSLGSPGGCDTTTQHAVDAARARGAVVVAAAGNSNADASTFSPASCAGVITVAAVGRSGARAFYSNYGPRVDVSAPGGDFNDGQAGGILSTVNAGTREPGADSYAVYQGTSMAAPHVSGVVALMLARNAQLTADQVASRLRSSSRPLPLPCPAGCGAGLVDAHAAVLAAGQPPPVAPPPAPPPPSPRPEPTPPPPPAPPAVPARQVKEVEPNNKFSNGQRVSAPVTVKGSLSSRSDIDTYRVEIAAGRTLIATLVPNRKADYDLNAYDAKGTLIASSRLGLGEEDSVEIVNPSATSKLIAYVRVVHFAGPTGKNAGSYLLTLR
jgi:serine protease